MPADRCVVFDIDDTLYLERDYVRSGFEAVGAWAATALGLPGIGGRAWAEFEAGRRGDVFDRILAACGLAPDPAVVRAMVEVYRRHAPGIVLLDDARACLDVLARRARLAVVSDGPLESQAAKVRALELSRWAAPVILTASLGPGRGKPHPHAFELVERETACSGPSCAYVADNPSKDFAGPASLGWVTVRVRRREGLHAAAPSGRDVRHELDSLAPLAELLGIHG